jgi:hypothetical protein
MVMIWIIVVPLILIFTHSYNYGICRHLFQVRPDDIDELVGRVSAGATGGIRMGADMIFHHFRHEAIHCPARSGYQSQYLPTLGLILERTIYRFHLTPNAPYPSLKLFLVPDRVTHGRLSCYSIPR